MDEQRSKCSFISGPMDAPTRVAPVKWWIAISRDVLAKSYRRESSQIRLNAICQRTPTFKSPLRQPQ